MRRDCTCARAKHQHGTLHAYMKDGCRCGDCRAARTNYERERRLSNAQVAWSGPARHVEPTRIMTPGLHPGAHVYVNHVHPRTQQRGLLPAMACAVLSSGRVVLHLHIEGKRYRVITDPSNVRPC